MGEYYEQGAGVEPDAEQAVGWYEKAAELKSGPAILRLARAHLNGELGFRKDFRKALVCAVNGVLTKDADCIAFFNSLTPEQAGNLRGYYALKMRKRAPGLFSAPSAENRACKKVSKDIETGFIYYSKYLVTAAESGFAEAQWLLGLVYGLGKGVERDLYQAFYWFEQSAALGYLPALEEVMLMLNTQNDFHNAALAEHYYDFAIEMGSTRKDLAKALYWYERAAENGDVDSMVRAAVLYKSVRGTEVNWEAAFRWYEQAAQAGNAEGEFYAGFCYCMPRGMEQRDLKKGVYWYEKAVAQGHTIAMFNLGWMYAMGNGVPQDIERGVKLFRELLDKGDFRGKFSIGRCLVEAIGMEMDKEAGFKLIREAAPKYERARKYLEEHDPDRPENS